MSVVTSRDMQDVKVVKGLSGPQSALYTKDRMHSAGCGADDVLGRPLYAI